MLSRLKRDRTMAEAARAPGGARVDLALVADMVAPGSKVLDIGAGDGELLRILGEHRGVDGRGIELSREGVNECVAKGLAVARMGAHITYLSDAALHRKFGRKFQDRENPTFSFDADFEVESYLRHQGSSFVERFDANSYLYLTRAMDYFDLAADYNGVVANAFRGAQTRFCVVSFTSDWLFPTVESRAIVHALNASGARVSFAEIVTDKGHDAFLLDEPELFAIVRGFLDGAAKARGLTNVT